jgi:hypothetical protein
MAHITTLSAVMFSDLSMTKYAVTEVQWAALQSSTATTAAANLAKLFDNKGTAADSATYDTLTGTGTIDIAANEFVSISHLKEFPSLGTPANIVKVPEYGSPVSKQIQGQADAPTMEITLNYIPDLWAGNHVDGKTTNPRVNDQTLYVFRFTLMAKDPLGKLTSQGLAGVTANSGGTGGVAGTAHSCFYFLGKLEALEVTASLTEAVTAKLTISAQSEIKGAYTNAATTAA